MEDTKKWYQSKTIWGVIVNMFCKTYLVARIIFKFSGIELPMLPPEFEAVAVDVLVTIGSVIGDFLAIIGRIKAERKIR